MTNGMTTTQMSRPSCVRWKSSSREHRHCPDHAWGRIVARLAAQDSGEVDQLLRRLLRWFPEPCRLSRAASGIRELNSFLTGWVTYFRCAACKSYLTALDSWIAGSCAACD